MISKEKKLWFKIGGLLIVGGIILSPTMAITKYVLQKASISEPCSTIETGINIYGNSIGVSALLVISGILCILPISDWLEKWKGKNK